MLSDHALKQLPPTYYAPAAPHIPSPGKSLCHSLHYLRLIHSYNMTVPHKNSLPHHTNYTQSFLFGSIFSYTAIMSWKFYCHGCHYRFLPIPCKCFTTIEWERLAQKFYHTTLSVSTPKPLSLCLMLYMYLFHNQFIYLSCTTQVANSLLHSPFLSIINLKWVFIMRA